MALERLRNTNPLGDVDLPLIGRSLTAGEEFDVTPEHAAILLQQAGNYEPVSAGAKQIASATSGTPTKSAPKADWVAYAQAHGDEAAADKTKEQLIAEHGADEETG